MFRTSVAAAVVLFCACGIELDFRPSPAPSPAAVPPDEVPVEEPAVPTALKLPLASGMEGGGEVAVLTFTRELAAREIPRSVAPGTDAIELPLIAGEVTAATQVAPDGTLLSATVVQGGCAVPALSGTGKTLHVPQDFGTLQAAVDAAAAGDVVQVAPGVYSESVRLKSGVALLGSGAHQTVLDAQGKAMTLVDFTNAENVVIAGFTFRGVAPATGCGSPEDPYACSGNWYAAALYADGHDSVTQTSGAVSQTCSGTSAVIVHNVFADNFIAVMPYFHAIAVVRNNLFLTNVHAFVANHLQDRGVVANNVFWGNAQTGVGITAGYVDVVNNVIAGSEEGLFQEYVQQGKIRCNLFFMNAADDAKAYEGAEPRFTLGQDGNSSADPLFEDPGDFDFRLQGESPARDTGCLSGPDPDGSPSDIGAYGGPLGDW